MRKPKECRGSFSPPQLPAFPDLSQQKEISSSLTGPGSQGPPRWPREGLASTKEHMRKLLGSEVAFQGLIEMWAPD